MSKAALKWAKAQDLPFTEKAVLIELADAHSPRWGTSKPSQEKVASNLGISRETVNRVIKRLAQKRMIAKVTIPGKKGQWDSRAYLLNPDENGIESRPRRVTQDHTAPCDSHQTRHRVTEDHTSRGDTTRARSSQVLNFPSQNFSSEGAA